MSVLEMSESEMDHKKTLQELNTRFLAKNSVNNIVKASSVQAGLICGEGEEASISHRCH